jgi:ABC-type polysaccharide/polyol phosphate transport system ATPase subunit
MSSDGAVSPVNDLIFDAVSKRYLVRREAPGEQGLHPWLRKLRALRRKPEEFWALRDVSFAVERGETLGIIGHNGAGKSTILKLLSNITSPTAGEITINGRLSALIEVGSGFHPELTGRENIFLNGAILGMRRGEIAEKLDSITDFAGIRPFLDVPVKRFSSGMYVRLGFSIAAHLDPDILLLDEVLAVGDAAFQEKCLNRIAELKGRGTTIVFISHDLAAVQRICDRVILMRRGEIVTIGTPRAAIDQYQRHSNDAPDETRAGHVRGGDAFSTTLTFHSRQGLRTSVFETGDPLVAEVDYDAGTEVEDAVVEVLVYAPDRTVACQLTSEISGGQLRLARGRGRVTFTCPELALRPGLYYADVLLRSRNEYEALHAHPEAAVLRVDPGKITQGEFYQPQTWTHEEHAAQPPAPGRRSVRAG